ncbi:MAG: MBL fold metallo-hydrolase [Candidatus Binatia bacterium]|nr:MBL fold metallo-hydrolase [Candidatus Binatia bacterium]
MASQRILPHLFRALVIACALLSAHCDSEPRRLPYIPPKLENWPQPYRGVAGLQAHVLVTGFLELPQALVYRNGSWLRTERLPVSVLAVQHPSKGVVLIDSGLPTTEVSPARVWPRALLLPNEGFLVTHPGEELPQRLRQAGIRPEAVRWVVQTNLRAVRTGGLQHFPQAKVAVTQAELDYASRHAEGYEPELWSSVREWHPIDFAAARPLGTFPRTVDLLGDGSVVVLDGRGPSPGTVMVLVRTPNRALLWTSDVVPTRDGLRTAAEPHGLWNAADWWLVFWQAKRLRDLAQEVEVLPALDITGADAKGFPARLHSLPTPMASPRKQPTPNRWERILPRPW